MKRSLVLLLILLFLPPLFLPQSITVKAQTKTIIVPDDYSTITSAIGNSTSGDTIYFRNGNYNGPINQTIIIDKTLTIIGESTQGVIITLFPAFNVTWIFTTGLYDYSDGITVLADGCKFQNLTIIMHDPGGDLSVRGDQLQVVGCNVISGYSTGLQVNGSYTQIIDSSVRGLVQLNGNHNQARGNTLENIYLYGSFNLVENNNVQQTIGLANTTDTVILANSILSSSLGYSGIDMTWSNNNYFYKNRISGYQMGFRFWYSLDNIVQANTINDSLTHSISLGMSSRNEFFLNNFMGNPSWRHDYIYDQYSDPNFRQYFPNGPETNYWDNGTRGNFWEEYKDIDLNGDGIWDTPYLLNETVYEHGTINYTSIIFGQDNFPLTNQVNIDDVPIYLPQWTQNLPPQPQIILIPSELPSQTPTSSPTPTVRELSWFVVVPLLLSLLFVALVFKRRKTKVHVCLD